MTDTPIYNQLRQELEAGAARTDHPNTARRSRAAEDTGEAVSVWALVNEHRNGTRG